ncbi:MULTISPECIES: Fur family transcriptional regulator [unclassified Thioclava]|uniref:Fur family transcriptional regulator n=1 Tax=unclassified Thioclava TaxID=2621713 RepID=UPI000B546EA0|nr:MULTISPECIES: Fur family transcriptional regulator [unclassified Thioclava]OWY04143.1 Fur family transcriptional regulator [Thioclava sp. IC9]OWY05653.1 Fur family transcriptional regulator [Thioclava sp. F1Mire-8]OWY10949.1 Fur family transcriptional regulator [Thioclava sp. F42-5]OWY18047.1 Fur family transcriptional regulator [Thioclava sp. JM3]PWE51254.1 transcriptional repressor [Thioclava sp. NG1]
MLVGSSTSSAKAFTPHDHSRCAGATLARAEAVAAEKGARLTPVRKRALEILLEEHRAMGAYEVLDRLAADGYGKQPPVAYRALEFLVEHGLAHRVRRLNAFAACMSPGEKHAPVFLICRNCGEVAEAGPEEGADEVRHALQGAAERLNFHVERATVEALGLCPNCAAEEAQ